MKSLMSMFLTALVLVFFSSCDNSKSSSVVPNELEVNGPGGAYEGVAEFSKPMIAGQSFYTFDESDARWIHVLFNSNSELFYQFLKGDELGGTYSVEDGKIVVTDNDKNPTIALSSAKSTEWEVTGTDNDGKTWQDTWHLELKFKSEMFVGQKFLNEYVHNGIQMKEELFFTETTLKIYDINGTLRETLPYHLENNTIVATGSEREFTFNLIFIKNGVFNVWFNSITSNESGYGTWSPEVLVDKNNNNSDVTLQSSEVLVVSLDSNPTTGYQWSISDINTSILEQVGTSIYKAPEQTNPSTSGASGTEVFYFRAINHGSSSLQLVYKQPWETEEAEKYILNLSVQ